MTEPANEKGRDKATQEKQRKSNAFNEELEALIKRQAEDGVITI